MKNLLKSLAVIALAAAVPAGATQQEKTREDQMAARTAVHQEALRKVGFLEGTWKGKAWYAMGPGPRHEVEQTEIVQFKQHGVILLIEGLGRDTKSGSIVHDALGVLAFDEAAGNYRLRSWSGAGRSGEFEAEVGANRLTWRMKVPGNSIRYTVVINEKGEWFEIGERSTDEVTWTKFMEMTLQKVS